MRGAAFNIESVKRSDEAEELIKEHQPDVVFILQAYKARRWLRKFAKRNGYKHFQYWGPEAKSIATLIKKDEGLKIERRGYGQMRQKWKGPKAGRWHMPRRFPWFRLNKHGDESIVIGIHFPTRNEKDAQEEAVEFLDRFRRRHPNVDIAAFGDYNMRRPVLEKVAKRLDAIMRMVGSVDGGLFWPGKGRELHVWAKSLRKFMQEGAHGWGMYGWRSSKVRS